MLRIYVLQIEDVQYNHLLEMFDRQNADLPRFLLATGQHQMGPGKMPENVRQTRGCAGSELSLAVLLDAARV
jgi:hypothetical protein